jgi:predicted kinase
MKRILILLAGYPATGKSTFCRELLKRHPELPVIAPDDIKEQVWDEFGFDNLEQKTELEKLVWKEYYCSLEQIMSSGGSLVTDYPFSDKQKPQLVSLLLKYSYHAITIRFVGNLDVIYKRSLARDLSQDRHLGHLMNHYHKGDYLQDRTKADALVTREILEKRCIGKGYGKFVLGDLIEVDATDIESVDSSAIIDQVDEIAKRYD